MNIIQGGDSLDPSNYRPLTVPSNMFRILTLRMCDKMIKLVEKDKLLGEAQFGFRKGRSTADAVFILSTMFQKAKAKR